MTDMVNFTAIIFGVAALWFVWDLGFKKLTLDRFRERLFELRFELFAMAADGEISFDSELFRAMETLMSGLLRYSHRMTFITFVLSLKEQEDAKKADEYVDCMQLIRLKVSRTPVETQAKLTRILSEISKAILAYITSSSLLFLASIPVMSGLHGLRVFKHFTKATVSSVLESEAYRAEARQKPSRHIAATA